MKFYSNKFGVGPLEVGVLLGLTLPGWFVIAICLLAI